MTDAKYLEFFTNYVVKLMIRDYGFSEFEALEKFLFSESYQMLCNAKLEYYAESPYVIYDLWENEYKTGNPLNSVYLQGA